jgi:hypothetical protein
MGNPKEIVLSMIKKQVKEIDPSANIILYGSPGQEAMKNRTLIGIYLS